MQISRQTGKDGKIKWIKAENKSKTHCDTCGSKLWVSPCNMIYCYCKYK